MKFKYEDLEVYKLSKQFALDIYKLSKKLPDEEKFGLTSQMRRAATSILLNIVEGTSRRSKKDFAIFIERSIGSLLETKTILELAVGIGYMEEGLVEKLEDAISEIFFKQTLLEELA